MSQFPLVKKVLECLGPAIDHNARSQLAQWYQLTHAAKDGQDDWTRIGKASRSQAHQSFLDPAVDDAVRSAESQIDSFGPTEAAWLRRLRLSLDHARALPDPFVDRRSKVVRDCGKVLKEARPKGDFPILAPHLERIAQCERLEAEYLASVYPGHASPMDILLQIYAPGATLQSYDRLTHPLRGIIRQFGERVRSVDEPMTSRFSTSIPIEPLISLARDLGHHFGYDLNQGGVDRGTTSCSIRLHGKENRCLIAPSGRGDPLRVAAHELGHGVELQNRQRDLADAAVMDFRFSPEVTEVWASIWEFIYHSRPFWEWFFPRVRKYFPPGWSPEDAFRHVNRYWFSPEEGWTDPLSLMAHSIMRTELETRYHEHGLGIAEFPRACEEVLHDLFGVAAIDIHRLLVYVNCWFGGQLGGYNVGYARADLGSMQIVETFTAEVTDWEQRFAVGDFDCVISWMVRRMGDSWLYTLDEVVERVTGKPLSADAWLRHVTQRVDEFCSLARA